MTILLVRHGETDGNAARILQRPDVPLNERGMRQAEQLAQRLSREALGPKQLAIAAQDVFAVQEIVRRGEKNPPHGELVHAFCQIHPRTRSYRHFSRIAPFGQVLFGAAHANAAAFGTANTQNAFAMTAGGGVDYKLLEHFSVRPFQAEYLMTRFGEGTLGTRTQNNLRVSTGFLFRF